MQCHQCRYFHADDTCHRYAPSAIAQPYGPNEWSDSDLVITHWPPVEPEMDACGDYAPAFAPIPTMNDYFKE